MAENSVHISVRELHNEVRHEDSLDDTDEYLNQTCDAYKLEFACGW